MSHYFAIAVVPAHGDPAEHAARQLRPYDQNLPTGPRMRTATPGEIRDVRRWLEAPDAPLATLARLADGHFDEQLVVIDGEPYWSDTRNPQARWDYWLVGGHYHRRVHGDLAAPTPRGGHGSVADNTRPVRDLPANFTCHACVLPDETWLEASRPGHNGDLFVVLAPADSAAWWTSLWDALEAHPDHLAVGVHCHI